MTRLPGRRAVAIGRSSYRARHGSTTEGPAAETCCWLDSSPLLIDEGRAPLTLRTPLLSVAPTTGRLQLNFRWFSDRKSTRLNSSHSQISYAVFCLKKKKKRRAI